MEQGDEDAGAAGSDGVAEATAPPLMLTRSRVEAELADDGEGLYAEGFVELEEVDFGEGPAGFCATLRTASMGARDIHSGARPAVAWARMMAHGDCAPIDAREDFSDQQGGSAVADTGCVAGGDGAIVLEGGLEAARISREVSARTLSS